MYLNLFAISGLLIAFTCFGLIIILFKYGKTKVHRLWLLFNLAIGIWGLGIFFVAISTTKELAILSWRFALIGSILIPVFFFHVVNIFCEDVNKKAIIVAYAQGIIFVLIFFFFPKAKYMSKYEYLFNSFYYVRATSFIFRLLTIFWFGFVIWGHYKLFKFYKKANDSKRNQILYFFFGMLTGFLGGSMNFLPLHYIDIYPYGNFLIPIYCIIVTYAILKHQLMDIKVAMQKSFVYSILIAFITATYFIFVFLAEKLFQGLIGYSSLIVSITYAFFIALFFNPVKNKIQHFADRVFLRRDPVQIAQENELLRQELLHSEKLKTVATFASGMAHEIKNPLTAIKTFAEYLPQKTEDKEFLRKFSKIVGSEVEKIDNLVHQLLDFSKPALLQLKKADIHKLVDETLELLNNQFIKYNIKINKDYGDSKMITEIDQNQMKQVFLNLFLNSIEAMPSGGTLTVSTSIEHPVSRIKQIGNKQSANQVHMSICIQDTGCGIPKKDISHIFDPFYSTKEKGSGLGLSIVYNIIKEHKGSIKAESRINKGTKFAIEFENSDI